MTKPFFAQIGRLDEIRSAGPANCDYEKELSTYLAEPRLREYFFTRLLDPEWLDLLAKKGAFLRVPAPQVGEKENTVGFPFWPEGIYLSRIASEASEAVSRVLQQLPSTENPRVHDLILDIALSFPPAMAAALALKVVEGIRSPYHLGASLKLGPFISFLSKSGQSHAALQVAEAALEILPAHTAAGNDSARLVSAHPGMRLDLWGYEQVLNKSLPDLVDAAGELALNLFCNLLDRAILVSARDNAERRPDDSSHIWRPAIEEHEQNLKMDVRDLLVSAVREAADRCVRRNPISISDVVNQLERRGKDWWVFRRIALHVTGVFSGNLTTVKDRLLDRELFDSVEVRHEYFLLAKQCFGKLSADEQGVILRWIQDGPKYTDEQLKKWEEFSGRLWTVENKAAYVRQWKRDRLTPIEGALPPEWRGEFEKLLSEVGPPSHPEFTTYHEGGAWGPTSPRGRGELASMTSAELVAYLEDWKPTSDWPLGASHEGLGRELTALVAEKPEIYAAACAEFRRLAEPTYVRAVLQGFQDALKAKRKFEWPLVLDLCTWAVEAKGEILGRDVSRFEADPHWGWTRAAVARLLTEGFSSEGNQIPFELREKVWSGIEAGTTDPEPTQAQENKYFEKFVGGERKKGGVPTAAGFDPFTNSLNTPRGVAMEAVVRYALWVRSRYEESRDSELLAKGFDAMPEVREVLDFHLNPQNDPSITIRTIYGQRAPWLQLLDDQWAQANTPRIFSRARPELWHAAWDAYIGYSQPFEKVFDWLRGEYAYAVEQMGSHDHGWSQPLAPDYSLAQHLVSFYWRGKLSLESEILAAFLSRADGPLRAHVLSYIGRSLRNTSGSVPTEIIDRLKALWLQLVAAAKRRSEPPQDEFKEYGWWFASSKLDDKWSIQQLLEALRLAKRLEPDHLVVERLATLAASMPSPVVEALQMMIEGDSVGWGVLGWTDKAKEIIRTARKSGDARAREAAENLVNLLGSRGHFDFGELLKEPA
jgi:hypothetical protein